MAGNKPPLSLLVIALYQMEDSYENVRKKLTYFIASDYDMGVQRSDCRSSLTPREVEDSLLRMSPDQLQILWTSVFEIGQSGRQVGEDNCQTNPIGAAAPATSRLVRDLLAVHQRLTNVLSSLTSLWLRLWRLACSHRLCRVA